MKSNFYNLSRGLFLLIHLVAANACPSNKNSLNLEKDSLLELARKGCNHDDFSKKVEHMSGSAITNLKDSNNNNIFHVLVNKKNSHILHYMLNLKKEGYNLDKLLKEKNEQGKTPLLIAVEDDSNFDIVKFLIDKNKESICIKNSENLLPVEMAINKHRTHTTSELIEKMDSSEFDSTLMDSMLQKAAQKDIKFLSRDGFWKDMSYMLVNSVINGLDSKGVLYPGSKEHRNFLDLAIWNEDKEVKSRIINKLPDRYRFPYSTK